MYFTKTNRIILVIFGILLSFALGFFVSAFEFDNSKTIGEVMSSVDEIIDYNMNLSYTQQIYDHCSQKENVTSKFSCVNQYVIENYNSVPRKDVYSIDEMFDRGADCKSYSIYYATLAKMMGHDYLFVQLPSHIFTLVYFDKGYCLSDEKFYDCFLYEVSEE
jgi:hypothetical protein